MNDQFGYWKGCATCHEQYVAKLEAELAALRELSYSLGWELYKAKGMLTEEQYAALLQEKGNEQTKPSGR